MCDMNTIEYFPACLTWSCEQLKKPIFVCEMSNNNLK